MIPIRLRVIVAGPANSGKSLLAALLERLLLDAGAANVTFEDPELLHGALAVRREAVQKLAGVTKETSDMVHYLILAKNQLLRGAEIVVETMQLRRDGSMDTGVKLDSNVLVPLLACEPTVESLRAAGDIDSDEYDPQWVDEIPGIRDLLLELNTLLGVVKRSHPTEADELLGAIRDAHLRMASNTDPEYRAAQQRRVGGWLERLTTIYEAPGGEQLMLAAPAQVPGPYSGT